MSEQPHTISRRGLMGALGGALAGGAAVAVDLDSAAAASAKSVLGKPLDGVPDGPRPRTVPAITPGLSYSVFNQFDFRASDPTVIGEQGPGWFSAPGSYAVASLALPVGTRIRELTAFVENGTMFEMFLGVESWYIDNTGGDASQTFITIPPLNPAFDAHSVECDFTLQPDLTYSLVLGCYDNTVGVTAVRVGYQDTGAYVPVTPYRCYDSRYEPAGRITPSSTRTIDTTVSIDPATGDQLESSMIPANARAVTFNLVAVQATGGNNFAIAAGDIDTPGASHLAFSLQTPTVANAGTVDVSNGTVNVFGGGGSGSAHCIVDITGYYI